MMRRNAAVILAAGVVAGTALGWLAGRAIGSDNLPFMITFGTAVGLVLSVAIALVLGWMRSRRQ